MSAQDVRRHRASRTTRIAMMVGVPLLAVATAACGGSSASSTSSGGGTGTTTAGSGDTLAVADTSLGSVLVDGNGMTVYMLTADSPDKSSCATQCLVYWPAVAPATGTPKLGPGVVAKVGQTTTPDGTKILTAGGWPLYTFIQDQAPGDVTGEGVQSYGGVWYAVSPSGQPVKAAASSSSGRSY